MFKGKVVKAKYVYQRKTYVTPEEHHYEQPGEKPYIKYCCPICEALGNKHQLSMNQRKCPLCGVNLWWGTL